MPALSAGICLSTERITMTTRRKKKFHPTYYGDPYHMPDHLFLRIALAQGGACRIDDVAVRYSLLALGFVEYAPRARIKWENRHPHMMALTKKGMARAVEIQNAMPAPRGKSRILKKLRNVVIHKNDRARLWVLRDRVPGVY